MDKLLVKIENDSDFMNIVGDILENKMVQQMKNYRQHYETTCFEHCLIASYFCYLYCKKHNLDYISCAKAAMVHDLFYMIGEKGLMDARAYMLLLILLLLMKMLLNCLI